MEDVFAETESNFCAVGDEFVEVGGGEVEDAFRVGVEVPDVAGSISYQTCSKAEGTEETHPRRESAATI